MITRDFLIEGRDIELTRLEHDMVSVLRTIYDPELPVPI